MPWGFSEPRGASPPRATLGVLERGALCQPNAGKVRQERERARERSVSLSTSNGSKPPPPRSRLGSADVANLDHQRLGISQVIPFEPGRRNVVEQFAELQQDSGFLVVGVLVHKCL